MPDIDIVQFFQQYAYQPVFVYWFIVAFMTASSFGLPVPEELTLISAGLVAYMARNPDVYPPPTQDAASVNLVLLCFVCFFAVLCSDILIYCIGKFFGRRLIQTKLFSKHFGEDRFNKVNVWFEKYSAWACGMFRFMPGIRFPGHLSCGLLGVPIWKFILIDGLAALVSVPTQVLLVAYYGEIILDKLKEFKMVVGGIILIILVVIGVKKLILHLKQKKQLKLSSNGE